MCNDCGEEFVPAAKGAKTAATYKNFVVGEVLSAKRINKCFLTTVMVDVGDEKQTEGIQIITNAKVVKAGMKCVVAMIGAVVPAGASADDEHVVVKAAPIKIPTGTVQSFGMLCDPVMLGWKGGAAGALATVPDTFKNGSCPPFERPSNKKEE